MKIDFDALKFVHQLKSSGIPEKQAEAISEAFRDATGEAELSRRKRSMENGVAARR